ncbi:hypothetical protein WJX81_005807 [Elliptochloris bilobata]|uniref:Uncharacterized protein n=1 Tax=Elliptochloris bilobata TaxID=381761 RepID=A0AAW1QJY1_9CHLO
MKGKKTHKLTNFNHNGVNYKLKDCILVAWFYRPEEAQGGRKQFHGEKELFKSEHLDWCLAVTIEGKCQVHSLRAYQALKKVELTDYFTRFTYKPTTHEFRPDRVPVYCVCELPYNPDAYMVQCEACEDWFHPQCIGYTQAQVEPIKNFTCPECQQAGRDAKRIPGVTAARLHVVVRAQAEEPAVARRAALGLLAGAAALITNTPSSEAAFGEAARVFGGKATNTSGFIPYSGEGFALLLPARWNPSKEKDFPGVQLRYEDNGDAVNNLTVIVQKTDKTSIEGYGAPDKFLGDVSFLLGEQVFKGDTISEGGFQPNKVSAASLLDVQSAKDKNGKTYYKYEILTRSADGDEGGRHQLINAAVSNGNLYLLKVQIGDKRWFKGAKKDGEGTFNSFVVA